MTADEKDLLQSKTFWGLVITALAAVCSQLGITIDQATWVNNAVVVAGLVLSAYGRIVATKPVTSVAGLTTKKAAMAATAKQGASNA